ncbi:class I SAM-dependent methyltransferase [Endozoicomonas sp. SM1973]|uniref:Class I SAM-dependent methyltransferase n=1 Tax=Spartinivicinus marinus TaxID=2994442 RepID=A0A853I7G5_9GAMM|nr:class I SAM-dependent methyltransferase [Spartinivicinus marinus]MCX4028817.1 class I SAM-dependent methyltransferase [Spartinivicinus marinus]NYZ67632.1 class I SAM-dependent methyltransferase [Spartinivicinus marinus]
MKFCATCSTPYPSVSKICDKCGSISQTKDGFTLYAPEYCNDTAGFKEEFYSDYAQFESSHFWFRSRSELIVWALHNYFPNFSSLLEIGCGTGFVLENIAKAFPMASLSGSEILTAGLTSASKRLPFVEFIQMDARKIPFIEEFDVIGAFDVLEHIEEDRQVFTQMARALKKKGVLIITVPQHPWLWSKVDEYSCHVRRYEVKELHKKIRQVDLTILYSTSFISILLPAMVLSRLFGNSSSTNTNVTAELRISKMINKIFYILMKLELTFLKMGGRIPIGGSRLIVARKI